MWYWIVGGALVFWLVSRSSNADALVAATGLTAAEIDPILNAMYANGLPSGNIPKVWKLGAESGDQAGQIAVKWECPGVGATTQTFDTVAEAVASFKASRPC